MERGRPGSVDAEEGRREQVLSVVLLHVVEAAGPIDRSFHFSAGVERTVEQVQHLAVPILHVEHRRTAQRALVPRLAAALGIEGAAVQHRCWLAIQIPQRDEMGGEAGQVGVAEVEAFGHRAAHCISQSYER